MEIASRVFLLSDNLGWRLPITLTYDAAFNIQRYMRHRWKHLSNKLVGKDVDCNFCNNATMLMKRILINILEKLLFCLNAKTLYVYKQSLRRSRNTN